MKYGLPFSAKRGRIVSSFHRKILSKAVVPASAIALYLHIPFCRGKCPYCDFYSVPGTQTLCDAYTQTLAAQLAHWGEKLRRAGAPRAVASLYFGGGTPSRLGAQNIAALLAAAKAHFALLPEAEITLECNPSDLAENAFDLQIAVNAGVSRVSLGLQSAVESERRALGRQGDAAAVEAALRRVRAAGINNFSLDLMLGIPGQTPQSLVESIRFCAEQEAAHVSAYLLKIEEGTPFFAQKESLDLPDEEQTAQRYLAACEMLEQAGYAQYEISNFARPGKESRHNLAYWDGREYLGLGPAAHSFLAGERFYYPADLAAFSADAQPIPDGAGGDFEEYAMLRLRLNEGLTQQGTRERFGQDIPAHITEKARRFAQQGLLRQDANGIALTKQGFLFSNHIIGELLY